MARASTKIYISYLPNLNAQFHLSVQYFTIHGNLRKYIYSSFSHYERSILQSMTSYSNSRLIKASTKYIQFNCSIVYRLLRVSVKILQYKNSLLSYFMPVTYYSSKCTTKYRTCYNHILILI